MPSLKIRKESLMVVAGIVWMVAGGNVANLGIQAAFNMTESEIYLRCILVAGACVTLFAFHAMFGKLVKKNTRRIRALVGDKQNPALFLDAKGYAIMAVMMSGGFGMRALGLVPDWFVAFFYTGLGTALALAGVGLLLHRAHGEGWTFHARGRSLATPPSER